MSNFVLISIRIMKTKILVLIFILSGFVTYSQITIDQNDMPAVDDTFRTSLTSSIGVDYTLTGANYNWDFSSLIPLSQRIDTFVGVWSTPLVYNAVFIYPVVATIAMKRPDNTTLPGYQLTDVYEFYKSSSSAFTMVGYGAKLNGVPVPVKYNNPDYLYHFPVTYGTVDSSASAFGQALPGIGYFGETKKRVNHVDGWGTLTTPFGTFQTIRIKSVIETFDTIHMDSLGIGFGIPRTITEYKWLADGFGLPVLTVSISGLVTSIAYIDSSRNILNGIKVNQFQKDLITVYPNPANEVIFIRLFSDISSLASSDIRIFDMSGKLCIRQYAKLSPYQPYQINLSSLPKGIYMLEVKNNEFFINRKFLVL